jgi:hypothetical protein
MSQLEALVARRRDSINQLEELRLSAERSDPAVKRASEVIKGLEDQLAHINRELEKYDNMDEGQLDERTFGIVVIADRIKVAEDKLAEIKGTIKLRDKRDVLTGILNDAHERAYALINAEICSDANERITELMPHNRILIARVERSLILEGQEGGSAGETLSIAYAFLATLFNRSDHELPFIVDSPAGPIDLAIRPRIAELIPKLTDQFIAFTISSEREGFVPKLKQSTADEVQFITLFRKGALRPDEIPSDQSLIKESTDGIVIEGEAFFNAFQLDTEEL